MELICNGIITKNLYKIEYKVKKNQTISGSWQLEETISWTNLTNIRNAKILNKTVN